jgi:hypothetical protein
MVPMKNVVGRDWRPILLSGARQTVIGQNQRKFGVAPFSKLGGRQKDVECRDSDSSSLVTFGSQTAKVLDG